MSKQTITEFLEARIDEDEARAGGGWSRLGDSRWGTDNYGRNFLTPSAVLAECAAKRAILGLHRRNPDELGDPMADLCTMCTETGPEAQGYPCDTLKAVASVYSDHPDYDSEWAL